MSMMTERSADEPVVLGLRVLANHWATGSQTADLARQAADALTAAAAREAALRHAAAESDVVLSSALQRIAAQDAQIAALRAQVAASKAEPAEQPVARVSLTAGGWAGIVERVDLLERELDAGWTPAAARALRELRGMLTMHAADAGFRSAPAPVAPDVWKAAREVYDASGMCEPGMGTVERALRMFQQGAVWQARQAAPAPVAQDDARDAARYRWLEKHATSVETEKWAWGPDWPECVPMSERIDAALARREP